MEEIANKINTLPWDDISREMHGKGYSLSPGFLKEAYCDTLIAGYNDTESYRKTVSMERFRFGMGEYKYFGYPLPEGIQLIRQTLYPHLAVIANEWMKQLNTGHYFPESHVGLLRQCREYQQTKPTPLILRYGKGCFNTLHQDLYGEVYFPIQMALFLNEPGKDYKGGEFVMTQQTPRAQSKPIVLTPGKGDMLLFTNNFRPVPGKRGYYKATIKHGVSEVLEGRRHTLGIIFHDAIS